MNKQRSRSENGFSLPTVIALGVVASLWMLGTASMVVPATGRISAERASDLARSSAEASLDWALDQLNNPSTRSSLDGTTTTVPASTMTGSNLSGTVSVSNTAAPAYSYLYSAQLDYTNNAAKIQGGNGWRVVTATVSPTGSTGNSHSVRVILQPVYKQVGMTTQTWTQGPPTSIFNFAAFAGAQVGGNGNMITNSYDSSVTPHPTSFQNQYADVGTNGDASLIGNAAVGGHLNLFGSSNTASGGPGVTVSQGVDIGTTGATASGFSNVSSSDTYNNPQALPQTPNAPSGATNLGSINLSGNKTMTLTAGNYIVSSLSITGNAQLIVNNSSGPVNIYVQGAGSNSGIAIGGNGIANTGVPKDLRIWYSGTGDTQIAGNGDFTGVVYAPNSSVKIAGNGSQYGAVVGNNVMFNGNGTFHYDRSLSQNPDFMWNPPVLTTTTTMVNTIAYWQAVSWQEF